MIITIEALQEKILAAFKHNGFPHKSAQLISENLILTETCGVKSHGVAMVPAHIQRWNQGGYCKDLKFHIEKQTHVFSVVDSDNSIGMVSGAYCMQIAVNNAKKEGLHVVFAKHCNTYGAAFTYAKIATDVGLIGITFCNTPTAMAAWGGNQKLLGTNPIAIGIPGKNEAPILFDMATSIVAKSKFNEARKKGEQIPLGWGLDVEGNPTTDPMEAIKGFVLPMAQHKGYGLALCLDILSGVISGSGYSNQVNRFYSDDYACMNVGQTFVAIDPSQICDDDFYQHIDDYIAQIHAGGAIYPGENFHENRADALKGGLDISEDLLEQIDGLSKN